MQIYSAQIQAAAGKGGETGALVAQTRDALAAATGQPFYGWSVAAGAPVGSFVISTRVDGTAQLLDVQQKMAESSEFQQLGPKYSGLAAAPAETQLVDIIGTTGEMVEPKPVVVVTNSGIGSSAPGGLNAALAWSNSVLERAGAVTGASGFLGLSAAGPLYQVTWIFGADTGAQMDEMNAALGGDAEFAAMLDGGGGLFIPGSAQRVIMAQLP